MNATRERRIKRVSSDGVFRILSQLVPRIGLCEDAFRQTFRYEATVSFFRNLKYKIVYPRISHGMFLRRMWLCFLICLKPFLMRREFLALRVCPRPPWRLSLLICLAAR